MLHERALLNMAAREPQPTALALALWHLVALDYCIRMRFVLDSYAIRMRVYAQMCAA